MSETEPLSNQDKLDEMYHLTVENNEILRAMRRRDNIGTVFRFIYWAIILGALGGLYYFVSPLVNTVIDNKDSIQNDLNQLDQLQSIFPEQGAFSSLMDYFRKDATTTP